MHPVLFEWNGITIGAYGVMLALAFLAADVLFRREMRRRGQNLDTATRVFWAAVIGGVVGGKALYLLDHWSEFLGDPGGVLLSTQGFAAYGGFILAIAAILWIIRRSGDDPAQVFDAAAPSLALAYGIARIGCQLAGDGCYGMPTDLPWGMSYPDGIVPTAARVHPTPLYEAAWSWALFALLWRRRTRVETPFGLFFAWLFLAAAGRFAVEFIRLNPRVWLDLTSSQWIALASLLAATAFWLALALRRPRT